LLSIAIEKPRAQHRLAPGQHDEAVGRPLAPKPFDRGRQRLRIGELAAAQAIGADEFGIAEFAHRGRAVLLASRPEVAPGEAHEHRATARIDALALQREEHLLDRVAHGVCA
jgi:hypothetical protein